MQSKYVVTYKSPSGLLSKEFVFNTWYEMFNFIKENSTFGCIWRIIIDFI